jgi:S1-C subfamily serine protease
MLRPLGWIVVAIILTMGVAPSGRPATWMDEGLFLPERVTVPFDKERALKSIVRIRAHVYFAITAYDNPQEAAAARPTLRKVFLPEGITIWPIMVDKSLLDRLRIDAGLRLLPAYYEIARAFENLTSFPSQKIVPLEGAATGFFISPDGYFLTSYHVVREEIEAADRTEGADQPLLCRYLSFEIPVVEKGRIVGYRPLNPVQLIRNVSAGEAKTGMGAALLKADIQSPAFLDVDLNGVIADLPVWTIGFPIRTQRDANRRASLGYGDADGGLRIAQGKIQQLINEYNFTSTVDGLSGSSGGPILNQHGRVVGLVQDVYPDKEANRRAVVFSGGMVHVDIRAVMKRLRPEAVLGEEPK